MIATTIGAGSSFANIYNEVGDAGQTQATAQTTGGAPAGLLLTDIFGTLHPDTPDADLYLINILDPATFSATTVNATGGFLDTQLFLLTLSGAPVYFNDDADGFTFLSTLPAGNALGPITPGYYLLGVSLAGYDPVNINNQLLFASGFTTDIRGPAQGLQPAVLGGFSDDTFFFDSGPYDIQLTGAATVPEPGTIALFGLAAVVCLFATSRRRRTISALAV